MAEHLFSLYWLIMFPIRFVQPLRLLHSLALTEASACDVIGKCIGARLKGSVVKFGSTYLFYLFFVGFSLY